MIFRALTQAGFPLLAPLYTRRTYWRLFGLENSPLVVGLVPVYLVSLLNRTIGLFRVSAGWKFPDADQAASVAYGPDASSASAPPLLSLPSSHRCCLCLTMNLMCSTSWHAGVFLFPSLPSACPRPSVTFSCPFPPSRQVYLPISLRGLHHLRSMCSAWSSVLCVDGLVAGRAPDEDTTAREARKDSSEGTVHGQALPSIHQQSPPAYPANQRRGRLTICTRQQNQSLPGHYTNKHY